MSVSKTVDIGKLHLSEPVFLAPLAGYTDSPFRRIVRKFSSGLVFTEMISSMGIFYEDAKTLELLKFEEIEHPIAGQIFGSDPDKLAFAAKVVEDNGFDAVDINMGCPTPKILKSNSGGALLRDLSQVAAILNSVRRAVDVPLTIKVRKGFRKGENILSEVINIAESEGVDAITIHGITVEEGFERDAEDWESIRDVKVIATIPVIGNGGIKTESDAKKMFDLTNVDALMIGRAALSKPWFMKSCENFMADGSTFSLSINEKLNIIIEHIEMEIEEKGEQVGVKEMRKFIQGYAYGMKGATHFRNKLNEALTREELLALVRGFFVDKEEL
ncbi:MAG: tRNA dihydrouridine synthase DusB [Caldisericaceae bacterium]